MTLALLFTLTVLGAYRVWRLLAVDDFPPVMAVRGRVWEAVKVGFGPEWAAGVSCPWCSGAWIGLAAVGLVWHWHTLPMPGLWFCAVPAGLGIVAEIAERLETP